MGSWVRAQARRKREEFGEMKRAEMGIWECCELLNELLDESDPDLTSLKLNTYFKPQKPSGGTTQTRIGSISPHSFTVPITNLGVQIE